MEKLILCSKVLHDKEVSDKIKEISSLKKRLLNYEFVDTIEYSNIEEWEENKEEAFKIIKNRIDELGMEYNNDLFTFIYCESSDIWKIKNYLINALNLMTKHTNKEWANTTSYEIIDGIEGFCQGHLGELGGI